MRRGLKRGILLALELAWLSACGNGARVAPAPAAGPQAPPPAWVTRLGLEDNKLCGIGVAGAGFDERSPYPKELSRSRAVKNLAGILETSVEEAIVDRATTSGQSIELARSLRVDDDLVKKIDDLAEVEYWLDRDAVGPFAQQNFTYAKACVGASKVAATFKLDAVKLKRAHKPSTVSPNVVPWWINRTGKQKGGRLCAVGFSLPMFFADNTFEAVIEDIRAQLARVIQTLVSQYSEELSSERSEAVELMTVASTQAVSKGAIVTRFWYDRDGRGPEHHERTTYGWGCVYPVDVLEQSLTAVQDKIQDPQAIAKVRERAAQAFDELDNEIAKREERGSSLPSAPASSTPDQGAIQRP
jgi:hypothetical protein